MRAWASATARSRAAVASSIVSVRSGGAETQREGQRGQAGAEPLGVAVPVEQAHRLEQLPRPVADRGQHLGRGHVDRDDEGEVEQHRREPET